MSERFGPLRPCAAPRCHILTSRERCELHRTGHGASVSLAERVRREAEDRAQRDPLYDDKREDEQA